MMKKVIKFTHTKYQTRLTIPKGIGKLTQLKKYEIGRIWVNQNGNIEIEVLDLDSEKDRQNCQSLNGEDSRA